MTAPTEPLQPTQSNRPPRLPAWSWAFLLLLMVATTWWRGHTFGPSIRDSLGFAPWPVVKGQTEPLDCDEAAYGYIGRRLVNGATMYRDLTENKPPLGYWTYALAIWLGGATELTIRLLPIPLVLATLALVFWIGAKLRSPAAGCLAAFLYALLSTDPYLYGNGAQFELLINLFSVASLALAIKAFRTDSPIASRHAFAAGCCVAAASLVRQVAALNAALYVVASLLPVKSGQSSRRRPALALGVVAGFLLTWGLVALLLLARGSLADAYEDVIRYGGALATDTPADPNAPPFWMRLVTGNADPEGRLPSPFGKTDYLVWWGTGTWPLWLAGLAGVATLLLRGRMRPGDRLVAGMDPFRPGSGCPAPPVLGPLLPDAHARPGDCRLDPRLRPGSSRAGERPLVQASGRDRGACTGLAGHRPDASPPGARLPARAFRRANDPLQGRPPVGCLTRLGARARYPRSPGLGRSQAPGLGLAESAAFLLRAGRRYASLLRRPAPESLLQRRPSAHHSQARARDARRRASSSRLDFHRRSPFPCAGELAHSRTTCGPAW